MLDLFKKSKLALITFILVSGVSYASQEPKATDVNNHEPKISSKPSPVLGAIAKVASNEQDQDWVLKLVQSVGNWIVRNVPPVNPDSGNQSIITGGDCTPGTGNMDIVTGGLPSNHKDC